MTATSDDVRETDATIEALASTWAGERGERQRRRHLDPADFDALAAAGYLAMAVPRSMGGRFESFATSTRSVAEMLRTLAHGDPSVALVAAMHPAVLGYWLAAEENPELAGDGWDEQRDEVFGSALEGGWWGTITSEPGSGGDISRTRSTAAPDPEAGPHGYRLSGDKHFGSGSGQTSFMITTARPAGEDAPALFYLDMRDRPWDGSAGATLTAEWDGFGMTATQSHGMRFENVPATRMAASADAGALSLASGPATMCWFTAVVLGVVETAVAEARARLAPKMDSLRPYEQVEWTRAVNDAWLAEQAYEGALRVIGAGGAAGVPIVAALRAKTNAAELAESCLTRIQRVVGGATFSRTQPFGYWAEDVKALGFLRPPWGFAHDSLHLLTWS